MVWYVAIPVGQYIQSSNYAFVSTFFKVHTIFANKNVLKSSATIPLWNKLPYEIVNCGSLSQFIIKLY